MVLYYYATSIDHHLSYLILSHYIGLLMEPLWRSTTVTLSKISTRNHSPTFKIELFQILRHRSRVHAITRLSRLPPLNAVPSTLLLYGPSASLPHLRGLVSCRPRILWRPYSQTTPPARIKGTSSMRDITVSFLGTTSGGGPTDTRNCSSLVLDGLGNDLLWSEYSPPMFKRVDLYTMSNQCLIVQKELFVSSRCSHINTATAAIWKWARSPRCS